MQAGARFCSFVRFQKKLDFGCLLELHFGAFGTFLRRKHGFLGCLKITSFFIDFYIRWYPKMVPKINEKSLLSVILRQDGFKEVLP